MGKRHSQRITTPFAVRLFGTDPEGTPFVRLGHTVDVSVSGARIAGIYVKLRIGDVVGIQRGPEKAAYRVVWIGKMGSRNAGEIGLSALNPGKPIWGLDFPANSFDSYSENQERRERRSHVRFDCHFGMELRTAPDSPPTQVHCTDIAAGGCYLETWSPLPLGTLVYLTARIPTGVFRCKGLVRTVDAAFGMGIEFTEKQGFSALQAYLKGMHTVGRSIGREVDEDVASLVDNHAGPCTGERETLPPAAPNPRVLVAEDSNFLRNAYAMYLRRDGFDVITADDGIRAMELALSEEPDVIVMDLLMPRLGGDAALKKLKENAITSNIPVLVVSGLPSSNKSKLIQAGALEYVGKNDTGPEGLASAVRSVLKMNGAAHKKSAGSSHAAPPLH